MPMLMERSLSSYKGAYLVENERERFELFNALIPPLKELEYYINISEDAKARKTVAKRKLEMPILQVLGKAIGSTLIIAVPFLIVFFVVTNVIKLDNGEALFSLFEDFVDTGPGMETMGKWLSSFMSKNLFCGFIGLLLGLLVAYIIIPCLYFLFPFVLVVCTISTIFSMVAAKKEIKTCDAICKKMDVQIEQLVEKLLIPLQIVPVDYQYSEALEYFCSSYRTERVETVQEAIVAYDTYVYRRTVEQAQDKLHDDQAVILNEIHNQQNQLDRLQSTIRRVKNKVDWL